MTFWSVPPLVQQCIHDKAKHYYSSLVDLACFLNSAAIKTFGICQLLFSLLLSTFLYFSLLLFTSLLLSYILDLSPHTSALDRPVQPVRTRGSSGWHGLAVSTGWDGSGWACVCCGEVNCCYCCSLSMTQNCISWSPFLHSVVKKRSFTTPKHCIKCVHFY